MNWDNTANKWAANEITEADPLALKTADTDNVKDTHIDWGTGANQVSAVDVPIADGGGIITGTEVETALQENRTAIDASEADIVTINVELDTLDSYMQFFQKQNSKNTLV